MTGSVRELTSAIASGDTEAFARFYSAWFDTMYMEARRATGRDEAFCLDVVQDAMLRVIRALRPMDHQAQLRVWVRRVAQSCAYDCLRSERRRAARERAAAERAGRSQRDGAALAEAVERLEERLAWLRRELESTGEPAERILIMRHRFGWTLEQIGAALGLKPGAVHGRLTRATEALQRRAREQFNDG